MSDDFTPTPSPSMPTRVCRKCSTQAQTAGAFCPFCGKSYARRSLRISKRAALIVTMVAVLIVGGGSAFGLKVRHDHHVERERAAAAAAAAKKAAEDKAAQLARQAEQEREAEQARRDAQRRQRARLVTEMESSITKDARQDVSKGLLDGPIFYTSCNPLGGGNVDDLSALTTTFSCLAVDEKVSATQVRGYNYGATMNWTEQSWTWQLGG